MCDEGVERDERDERDRCDERGEYLFHYCTRFNPSQPTIPVADRICESLLTRNAGGIIGNTPDTLLYPVSESRLLTPISRASEREQSSTVPSLGRCGTSPTSGVTTPPVERVVLSVSGAKGALFETDVSAGPAGPAPIKSSEAVVADETACCFGWVDCDATVER